MTFRTWKQFILLRLTFIMLQRKPVLILKSDNRKKELQMQYKDREVTGGVFVIRNTLTNRLLLDAAIDLQGRINRFEFARKTGSCVDMKLQKDWADHGSGLFVLEVLEELKKGEIQTDAEFKADINILKELWLEKLSNEDFY